jgi:hypothetical protein
LLRKFKITEINVYNIFSEWTMTDCHTEWRNINHVGNEAMKDTSEDFPTVNGTAEEHEV